MTRRRILPVLCPVLFSVFTLLSLFAQNQSEVEVRLLWLPLALCVTSSAALYGLFLLVTKDGPKAGVLASLVVVGLLYYGVFFETRPTWFVALWLVAVAIGVVAVLRTRRDLAQLTVVLVVMAAVLDVPPAFRIADYQRDHPLVAASDPRLWPSELEPPPTPARGTPLPDIFVIIPDDYARTDVLQQYFDYDGSEFVHQLEDRGLVFSEHNRAPYSDSESNIAALLNMDYLTGFGDILGSDSEDVRPVQVVSEDSRASRLLTGIGYDYVHIDTDEVTYSGGNPSIAPMAAPDSLVNIWLRKSVLGQAGGPLGFDQSATDARFRDAIEEEFAELGSVPTDGGPHFVVFHSLIPHDPYLYDAQGRPVTYTVNADIDLSSDAGRAAYVAQLQHLNGLLLNAIDRIQARPGPEPVIVLQADEGFEAEPEVFGEAVGEEIRVEGLSALALPGLDDPGLPDPPNSVNVLRYVFNQYFGTHYEMLEGASYAEGDLPYDFSNVIPPE
jgi:hypothetical protein